MILDLDTKIEKREFVKLYNCSRTAYQNSS